MQSNKVDADSGQPKPVTLSFRQNLVFERVSLVLCELIPNPRDTFYVQASIPTDGTIRSHLDL